MIAPQGRVALINAESADLFVFRPKSVSIHFELMFTRPLLQTADIEAQHRLLNEVADLVDSGRVRSTMRENYGRIDAAESYAGDEVPEVGRRDWQGRACGVLRGWDGRSRLFEL